jgi:Protein of unknown function (DUF3096)
MLVLLTAIEQPTGREVLDDMHFGMFAQSVIALIAGILILLIPRLLSYIVAIYLIIFGILGLVR